MNQANQPESKLWHEMDLDILKLRFEAKRNLEEDGYRSTRKRAIDEAIRLMSHLKDCKHPAPHRLVTDWDGGVVMTWRFGSVEQEYEIDEHGDIEWVVFVGTNRVIRQPLSLGEQGLDLREAKE